MMSRFSPSRQEKHSLCPWTVFCLVSLVSLWATTLGCLAVHWLTSSNWSFSAGKLLGLNGREIWGPLQSATFTFAHLFLPTITLGAVLLPLLSNGSLMLRVGMASMIVAVQTGPMLRPILNYGQPGTGSIFLWSLLFTLGWLALAFINSSELINRNRWLKAGLAGMLSVLMVSAVIISIDFSPMSRPVFAWLSFYGAAFLIAIIVRHWGGVTILPSEANGEAQGVSSRGLLELITLVALILALGTPWIGVLWRQAYFLTPLNMVLSCVLGCAVLLGSLMIFRQVMTQVKRPIMTLPIALTWILVTIVTLVLVGEMAFRTFSLASRQSWVSLGLVLTIGILGSLASIALVYFEALILRRFGWAMIWRGEQQREGGPLVAANLNHAQS